MPIPSSSTHDCRRVSRFRTALSVGLHLCMAVCVVAGGHRHALAQTGDDVRALLLRGEHTSALELAQRLADADPRDAQARFLQGVVLMEMGRDDDAMALFSSLAQRYPELPDPMNNIALLHARAGRLDQALIALQAALRNDPGHRTARANLGHVHLMLAVQAWDQVAASGSLEPTLQRKLEAARQLAGMPASGAGGAPSR